MDKKNGRISLGMIARDNAGKVVAALSTTQVCTGEPAMAEALAALQAMLFCQKLGFTDIIFEGDALQVVKAVNSKTANSSCYGHFVEGIQAGFLLCNLD